MTTRDGAAGPDRPARLRDARAAAGAARRASTPARLDRAPCARGARAAYDRLVVYADREHSANLSFLTGFDPRFEEAMLIVGPDDAPAILVGNECWGMAGAAPLPMRRAPVPGLQPAQPAARPVAAAAARSWRGRGSGAASRVGRARLEAVRGPVAARGARVPRRTSCARSSGPAGLVENANDLLDRPRRRPARDQRRSTSWRRSSTPRARRRDGVRRLLDGPAAGHDRGRGRRAARLGRDAAVVPPDADRRAAGAARAAQPRRPPDRARRPVHRRVRDLGRAQLPGGLGRRRTPPSCRTASATTSTGSWRRTSRRSPSGTARSTSARPAARSRRSSTAAWATRSSGSSSTPATSSTSTSGSARRSGRARRSSCAPGWRCRSTSSRPPARRSSRPTSRTASRSPTRRCGPRSRRAYPDAWARIQARRAFMRDALGIDLHPDVLPFSNIPAVLPPFLLPPGPRDDARLSSTARHERRPVLAFAGSRPALLSSAGRSTRNTVTPSFVSEDRVPLAREKKQEVITEYAVKDGDTGSPEVQVALLTERIRDLTEHLRALPEGQSFAPRPPQARGSAPAPSRVSREEGRHALSGRHRLARTSPLGLAAARTPGRGPGVVRASGASACDAPAPPAAGRSSTRTTKEVVHTCPPPPRSRSSSAVAP